MNISIVSKHVENRKFVIDDITTTPYFINNILRNLSGQIGAGAIGTVLFVNNRPDIVVKIYNPCDLIKKSKINMVRHIHNENCRLIREEYIVNYIKHNNIFIASVSNYLLDGVIGSFLNKLSDYTPHFIKTKGLFFSEANNTIYTVMERGFTDLSDKIESREDVYIFLFQMAHALYVAQKVYKFTHYDLHMGNIIYVLPDESKSHYAYNYMYRNRSYDIFIPTQSFIVKIIDYGLSRVETPNIVVNQRLEGLPINSYGVFDPYYDFAILLGSYMFDNQNVLGKKILLLINEREIAELLFLITGIYDKNNESSGEYIYRIYSDYYNGFRPITNKFDNPADISFILRFLDDKLSELGIIFDNVPYNVNTANIYRSKNLEKVLPEYLPRTIIKPPMVINIGNSILYRSASAIFPKQRYNMLVGERKSSVIHVAEIIPDYTKYKFKTICCKMEPMEYMNNKYGVAINGTFFDINHTYNTIGPYRELMSNKKYFESNIQVSEIYKKYYGIVSINLNKLEINEFKGDSFNNVNQGFIAGPILIWQGSERITPEILDTTVQIDGRETKIFQCREPANPNNRDKILSTRDSIVYNCKTISLGELSHGSNPNPRSMLIITRDNHIIFLVAEGRTKESTGLDLYDMTIIAKELNAYNAINLDGGQSSNIVMHSRQEDHIISSFTRKYSYPVGNIIAYIEKPSKKTSYENYTVLQLKNLLKQYGLSTIGKKSELIKTLNEYAPI